MTFRLKILEEAKKQIVSLKAKPYLEKRLKAVNNALKKLQENPRHPSLNVHPIDELMGPNGEKIWEAYAENNTPGAYRIFFYYGSERQMISIVSIIPHPD
jgi:mRNA-degrading endonuclease RelE of RelBE toxin-antitoxin system